ncbi:MAG: universal stress protein [Actinomycetaceae bacterium]|nr:universal stress protein [Actinomycetaceae bacterium]MDU0971019.1 universal stress protein [Actinomycetaceae bacterium]
MTRNAVPQPSPTRLVDFSGHALVVAVKPGQSQLVALTADSLGRATGASMLMFAYVDESRYVVDELDDGHVISAPISPDSVTEDVEEVERLIRLEIEAALADSPVPWHFRYLAGRADRALTHLARTVDAAAFVVGATSHKRRRMSDFVNGSIASNLAHHQHRPVLVVPTEVVDWKDALPWQ